MESSGELVLGVVRTVGTDAGPIMSSIEDCLKMFNYDVKVLKVSKGILSAFSDADEFDCEYDRIDYFMNLGDKIRCDLQDCGILMAGVAAYIHGKLRDGKDQPLGRVAYIIDSLKHPAEAHFLRQTYGDGFHLIGITDSYENRKRYLINRKGMTECQAVELLARDEHEGAKQGQRVRDVYQDSDYFLEASHDSDRVDADVRRLLDLLFGNPFITPTFSEYAMFRAYVASLRSADMSRQVGAVIARADELLAEGVNDCARAGGGLYWLLYDDVQGYHDVEGGRDYTLGYDTNKRIQQELISTSLDSLQISADSSATAKLKDAGIGNLMEYGRMVHAEMEALMMCARNGISTRDATMFVTTFPCHNCAKHIIAAGISSVCYIEPYPKSETFDFYKIETSLDENVDGKVHFRPFYGVGPHRFVDLFSMKSVKWRERERKGSGGDKLDWARSEAALRNLMSPLSYIAIEKAAYIDHLDKVTMLKGGA